MTTSAAIRDLMRTMVGELTPTLLANVPFKPFDERSMSGFEFREWCEKNPTGAFRRVSILDEGNEDGPVVSNTDREWIEREFLVQIAYPRDHRYGAQQKMDLHDVAESDMKQVEHKIGTNGYARYNTDLSGAATITKLGVSRESGPACVFSLLRLSVRYWRSMS